MACTAVVRLVHAEVSAFWSVNWVLVVAAVDVVLAEAPPSRVQDKLALAVFEEGVVVQLAQV